MHNKVVRGYIGFTPSVRLSVRPSRILCPLCSSYSSGWIHFILIHLIKQLQKVCRVQSLLQNFKIWILGKFLRFVTLTVLQCESLVWVIMGRHGVSQNAGILVVLVYTIFVSLLPKTLRISYMIGVYMGWSPKQHPSMYYVLNTHHRHCNRDMIILMLRQKRHTWTALQHMMKAKHRSDIIDKISNHPKNSPSFIQTL